MANKHLWTICLIRSFGLSQAERIKGILPLTGFGLGTGRNTKKWFRARPGGTGAAPALRTSASSAVKIISLILLTWARPAAAGNYSDLKERAEDNRLVDEYIINTQKEVVTPYPQGKELENIEKKLDTWKKEWEQLIAKTPDDIALFQSSISKEKRLLAQSDEVLNILKGKVDLNTVIATAFERNPRISEAKKKWRGTLEKFSQASHLEHLMGQYEAFARDLKPISSAMAVKPEFPFPGLTTLKGDIALKEAEIARQKYHSVIRDILTRTQNSYYQRVFLTKAIEILQEDTKLLKDLESSALTKYNTGKTGYSNVIKINTMIEKTETDLKNETENEQTLVAQINYLLNLPQDFPLGDFTEPKIRQRSVSVESLYKDGLLNRQELVILTMSIEKINLAIQMAEKKIYPDSSLGFSSPENVVYAKAQGKSAKMPKYWFGANDAYTKEARMNYQAMQKKLEADKRKLLYQLKDEVRSLNNSRRSLKLYQDSLLKLAQDDLEVSLKDYQGGRVGFLDVLEAEKQLLRYRLAYQMAIRDHHQSQARIRQLIGKDF